MQHTAPNDFFAPIAVVGMACRFPQSSSAQTFWDHLCSAQEGIQRITPETAHARGIPEHVYQNPHYVPAYASMDGVRMFDPSFFGLTAREAAIMDPQHRHFLECAWEALEHAGCVPEHFGKNIGVFAGSGMNHYFPQHVLPHQGVMETEGSFFARHTGNDRDFLATRVSYCFDLHGPSINVQTGCSTSLVAVHMACQSLQEHACDAALAGAVSIENLNLHGYMYQPGFILSPEGRCKAFDAQAKGTIFSNGVGIVVLKRLKDALAQKDTVYAVIRGSAINNDGHRKKGYTAPSTDGQAQAMRLALKKARCKSSDITYIEAHGSGTLVGDPVEWNAFTQAYSSEGLSPACGVGSVKTNIGHLDTAAGVAGLIKTCFALKEGLLPPTLYFSEPNPALNIEHTRFHIVHTLKPWDPPAGCKRIAAVNSLGIGGTNAHVIVEQPPTDQNHAHAYNTGAVLLPVSARTQKSLQKNIARMVDFLRTEPQPSIEDTAFTLQTGRAHWEHRAFVTMPSYAGKDTPLDPKTFQTHHCQATDAPNIAWMFPGNGTFYNGMAKDLYTHSPIFKTSLQACFEILKKHSNIDFECVLFGNPNNHDGSALVTVPGLFAIQTALAALWKSWGCTPQSTIGHSMGEYMSAYLAGVFSLEDVLSLVACRARIFHSMPKGLMLSIANSAENIAPWLSKHTDIAAYNAPQACVVSGPPEHIQTLQNTLSIHGIQSKLLHMSVAAHSHMLDPYLKEFDAALKKVTWNLPASSYVSTVTGTWVNPSDTVCTEYWIQHLRNPVFFAQGIETLLQEPQKTVFIEIGPGQVLSSLLKMHPAKKNHHICINSLPHPQESTDSNTFMLDALGKAWLHGVNPSWESLYIETPHKTALPTYAFEHEEYWIDAPSMSSKKNSESTAIVMPQKTVVQDTEHFSPTEKQLQELWCSLLGVSNVGLHDTFFDSGGHSLLAVRLFAAIKDRFHVDLTLSTLFKAPTLQACAAYIDAHQTATQHMWSCLVPIQTKGPQKPFFCIHGAGGNVLNFALLSRLLGNNIPFYGLQAQGVDGVLPPLTSIEDMASLYCSEILQKEPNGPSFVAGYSGGGVVALEVAQQLTQKGHKPPCVVLFDTYHPQMPLRVAGTWDHLKNTYQEGFAYLTKMAHKKINRIKKKRAFEQEYAVYTQNKEPLPHHLRDAVMTEAYFKASSAYHPKPYQGQGILFKAEHTHALYSLWKDDFGWSSVFVKNFEKHIVSGDHEHMMDEPHIQHVAKILKTVLFAHPNHGAKQHETTPLPSSQPYERSF